MDQSNNNQLTIISGAHNIIGTIDAPNGVFENIVEDRFKGIIKEDFNKIGVLCLFEPKAGMEVYKGHFLKNHDFHQANIGTITEVEYTKDVTERYSKNNAGGSKFYPYDKIYYSMFRVEFEKVKPVKKTKKITPVGNKFNVS